MITDPTTLIALALCVGILGLVVLILPLLILFWSQMEPQLVGLVANGAGSGDDEYPSQAVLPKLMKSFGSMAELESKNGGGAAKRTSATAKPATKRKPAKTTARSKASSSKQTVKAAPTKSKSKAKSGTAKTKAKSKAKTPAKSKAKAITTAKTSANGSKPAVKKAKPRSAPSKRTPAGAKRDPILGVIYSKKPKEIDDLKQIKGVAKVIEGKLHKAGIYTFRQVVEWDAAAIEAFSDKLSFKGRISKDGWQKQCAKFHKDKYSEKIG